MDAAWPRYLLLTDTYRTAAGAPAWRFVLSSNADGETLSASDEEPGVDGDRLELLALVRGLEALCQPARVTLATPSRYVRRGLERGLRIWRGNGWKWERFGRMVSVRDYDLWRRVDLALRYHRLERHTAAGLADLPQPLPADESRPWRPIEAPVPPPRQDDAGQQFADEPVLMVVRSGRRTWRFDRPRQSLPLARASAG